MPNPEQETFLTNEKQKLQQKILIEIQRKNGEIETKEFDRIPLNSRRIKKGEIPGAEIIRWTELVEELSQIFDCQPPDIISVTYKYPNFS